MVTWARLQREVKIRSYRKSAIFTIRLPIGFHKRVSRQVTIRFHRKVTLTLGRLRRSPNFTIKCYIGYGWTVFNKYFTGIHVGISENVGILLMLGNYGGWWYIFLNCVIYIDLLNGVRPLYNRKLTCLTHRPTYDRSMTKLASWVSGWGLHQPPVNIKNYADVPTRKQRTHNVLAMLWMQCSQYNVHYDFRAPLVEIGDSVVPMGVPVCRLEN
jgi:hypothetical protein